MVVLFSLLALGMVATGVAAMVFGAPIVQVERGWTMVIAGSVGASSGFVLLGLSLVAQRLGRIAQETVQMRDRLAQIEELTAMRIAEAPPPPLEPDSIDSPLPPPPLPPARSDENAVVGQYASGGNSYTMYADGSIRAELPSGPRRFSSINDLRAFVAGGGERG